MPVLVDVSECLRDTPRFRQTLSENERSVQQLETKLDKLLKACDVSVQAGEQFFSAQEQLMTALLETSAHVDDREASTLLNDVLQCLLTLKRFESSLMDQLREVVAKNCVQALKRELTGVKESRLTFEKVSGDLDAALVRHAQAPRSRMQEVRESGLLVNVTRSQFKHAGLDYLHRLSVTQCVKRLLIARLVRDCFAAQQSFFSQGLGACQQLDACLAGVQRTMTRLDAERSDLEQLVAGRRAVAASTSPEEDSRSAAELPRTASPTAGAVSIEGYLFKRASNAFRTWSRRWFMLDCSQLKYQRRSGDELTVMEEDLRLCMVKPAPDLERRCCFEVVSPSKSHMVQADSPRACQLWVEALQTAIGAAFDQPPPPSASARRVSCADSSSSTSTASTCSSVLQQVVRVAGNDVCADCGQSSPSWASINLGVTLCIQCSGIHRSLGVQVSKIRSLTLDDWEPEVLKSFAELGNAVVNEVYEAETPSAAAELRIEKPKPTSDRPKREAWIRAKYSERRFVGRLSPSAEGNGDGGGGSVTRRWSVRRLRRRRSRSHDKRGRRARQAPQPLSRPGLDTLVIGDQLTSSLPQLPDAELLDSSGTSSSDEQPTQPEQPLTPDSLLFRAAAAHNLPVMCQALAWGAHPSWRNPAAGGRSALHAAVGSGSAAACQYLLLNGAAASAVDDADSSPLHRAVEVGHMGQVCVLLKHRVDQHLQDRSGRDALSIAVERADADMVTILRLALLNEQMRDEECSNGGDDTFNQVVKDFSLMASSDRPGSRIPDDANT